MSTDLKLQTSEENTNKGLNSLGLKGKIRENKSSNDDDVTTVFRELHISALSKAANISPTIRSVTLGAKASPEKEEEKEDNINGEAECNLSVFGSSVIHSSTPEKITKSVSLGHPKLTKVKKKLNSLSPIVADTKSSLESCFSYQKLLHEYDVQRRLTVDKVMRERIENMYDTEKLFKDSLEHLKQTRLEESIAKRLQLERKILDDVHEQEILNKPKREAQWAKENLKEAQRIQERNQKVKEAEEEARKKSEAILLKRKQIDKILFELQKEYNQEYKNMLETIKLCKDKAALTESTAPQSKMLKDCAAICEGLLKKCKLGDVSDDDVEKAKKLVETIKSIHECFSIEITKINESVNAQAKQSEAVKKNEAEQKAPQKDVVESTTSPSNSGRSSNASDKRLLSSSFLKRKSVKSVSYACKKKLPKNENSNNRESVIECDKVNSKNQCISGSISGLLKPKRNFSLNNSNDFHEKGDVQKRNRNLTTFRKKCKRVRFSESTEIIDPGFSDSSDITGNAMDTELPTKEEDNKNCFTELLPGCCEESEESSRYSNLSDCFDARSLEMYLNLKNHLENFEKTLEPLLSDDLMKKFRFSCQKAVTIPVNAISPVSGTHMTDKYMKLHNLLSGRTVEVGDIKVTASQHPLGVAFCKNLLAKKFVRQGDLTVSSKPDAAFSIATVLASLWVDFPDFGQLVLAHFQSACPYLAPVFMPQVEGQSDEDYHRSLGYHYSPNKEVEKQDSFLKRMSGIMRLYCALLISNVRQPGKMNPLGLSEGWRWMSALLNLEPRPDICATLLYDFLEVAGNEMFRAYGGQFKKMLAYICQEYFPKLEKVTPSSAGGPIVRLEGFLQKILKEELIPPPHGVLPPNFWAVRQAEFGLTTPDKIQTSALRA